VLSPDQAQDGFTMLADPFIIRRGEDIFLFCEVMTNGSDKGSIAVYVERGDAWQFLSVVLDEPFHLSYPYVFTHGSETYMLPETKGSKSVRLYRATNFPDGWVLEKTLIDGAKLVDPSIVYWNDRWYLFVSRKRRLYLYHSEALTGEWVRHRASPLRRWSASRCAGRIIECEGSLIRFAQEKGATGIGVYGYRILELSPNTYAEAALEQNPILEPCGDSWARSGMHHLDSLKLGHDDYLGVFDGRGVWQET